MANSNRLPFDKRAQSPPGMRLTDRDVAVVQAVYEHRFLLRDQIQQLFFPSRNTANYRLKRLFHHGYLQRLYVPESRRHNVRNTQAIYCLDEEGASLLVAKLGIPREAIDWYPDRNKVGEFFIHHMLRINDFRIALTLAAAERGDEIVTWIPEWKLKEPKEQVTDPKTGTTYPVAPDAYFIYERGDTGKRAHFFLELDRATMENRRFAKKVRAYVLYRKTGGFELRYDGRSFRVLTVVPSRRRLRNLKRTTEKAGGKSMFWFTTFAALDPEQIVGPVWEIAGQDAPASLLREKGRG